MKFLSPFKFLADFVLELLVKEDAKIEKLLEIPSDRMRDLLPPSPVRLPNLHVLFDYKNKIVKRIVKTIKFKNHIGLKKRIAEYFYEEIIDLSEDIALFDGSPPIVVPMPMSKGEKRKKGFNPCEEICKEIEKIGNKDIHISYNLLKKIKETKRQTTLSREERLLNVQNCMSATFIDKKTKNTVIVIDDVFTTIASFREAERALKSAGFSRVLGLFIAH